MTTTLCLAQDPEADALLAANPLAVLTGMLLDQQVAMEVAFAGPKKIADRIGRFDAESIAGADPEEFAAACAQKPAVHRFPGSMAKRIQTLCQYLVEHYDGDVTQVWLRGEPGGKEVLRRLKDLPGFGDQKARIFLALLGKQLGVRPEGWREAAGAYGEEGARRSVADVVDTDTLHEVREFKRAQKAAAKK
ncbi:HhH-GPD-type base excision DNA repair protein [Haloechinothrix sp. LS1_15]|uniref:HhH-GPD-type base excision DNA repair protein n=1 Tax=Haloechinothrix sp. LS1_15 TaxID=2652248 RepID=UPI0029487409|nr:HhH-GPD-type base excision DNA repair protein [Haloechinothrix sp. LS1_15]MDV6012525.1 Fe-S cluster assembly protein HesB [Haloechinothrix sp. LS1_15]